MTKQQLEQKVERYEAALKEIAGFTFPQGGDLRWTLSASRVARHVAQEALDPKSDYLSRVHADREHHLNSV